MRQVPSARLCSLPARSVLASTTCSLHGCSDLWCMVDLALQLLRMHLTRAVALAEQTVNIYSELEDASKESDSATPPPELEVSMGVAVS